MARAQNFLRGLSSSYLLLFGNTISILVSLPLALHFLERSEYTVWLVVTQMAGYLAMIDLGTSGSGIRLLVDHKDQPEKGGYGSLIKSMCLAQTVQAVIILIVGVGSAGILPALLKKIPPELVDDFRMVWLWQIGVLAFSFMFRIGNQVLHAHQRMDISNYAQIGAVVVNLGLLLSGLALGWRLYSFVIAHAVSTVVMLAVVNAACFRLKLWPPSGAWGSVSRASLRELFSLGGEFFLIVLAATVTTGCQVLLLTRLLSLDAALVWAVMTKLFTLLQQMVLRPIGGATAAFSEMFVRGELDRLWKRYRTMFELSVLASGYFALLIGFGNDALVKVWTNKPISWGAMNNWLLASWLVLLIQVSCHISLLMYLKETRRLRIVYLSEAITFVFFAVMVIPRWGVPGLLLCSIGCTAFFTMQFGAREVSRIIRQPASVVVLEWFTPLLRFLAIMLPLGLGLAYLTRDSAWARLLGCVLPLAMLGPCVAVRFCLPKELFAEFLTHLPARARRIAGMLGGVACPANVTV